VVPTNVLVNNRSGDAFNDGQCEQDLAVVGNNIVVAWNDGHGFTDLTGDTQGYGYSVNGGTSFVDGGKLPIPAGMPNFIWTSDPIVVARASTGEFWFLALCSSDVGHNSIAVVKGTFVSNVLVWQAPVIVRDVLDTQFFLDKPWMAVDPANGNLYLTYTEFYPSGLDVLDRVYMRRSTNGGSIWSSDLLVNLSSANGAVQGSRPIVGVNGEVHVVWYQIGNDTDFIMYRVSINGGLSFTPNPVIASTFYPNFGTGGPGFNREMGIQFPSVAVDRSGGTHNGRVYITWMETVNWLNEVFSIAVAGSKAEVEPNNTAAQATPLIMGQPARGNLSSTSGENDYFSFTATQGQTYLFICDSLNVNQLYTMRIFCSNQNTRLAFSGDTQTGGLAGFIVWTAPANGTYYLRMANLPPSGSNTYTTGGYRVLTKAFSLAPTRGRDTRDIFVGYTDNNGLSWSGGTRVNDDSPWFDDWLPEVTVDGSGYPHVAWYDWRDSAVNCGGSSNIYMATSEDGGSTWYHLDPVTTAQSDWTAAASNIAPNQGDYMALKSDNANVYVCWADARNGDPDVFLAVWPQAATPVQISLATFSAAPDRVDLTWTAGGDPLDQAVVERRNASGDWRELATIVVDGDHRLTYTDHDVLPGTRYEYRLRFVENGLTRYAGDVWVEVPQRAQLAIAGVQPNPARRDAWVSFSLVDESPAKLEVIDVAGRLVRVREVGALGAGNHRLNLAEEGPLQAGVYIVRLTQGVRSVTSRMSVVH
jgi:hypothetical protein